MSHHPRYLDRQLDARLWRASAFARLESVAKLRASIAARSFLRPELISMAREDLRCARSRDRFARECGWRLP
jgi:hypothetical protein